MSEQSGGVSEQDDGVGEYSGGVGEHTKVLTHGDAVLLKACVRS